MTGHTTISLLNMPASNPSIIPDILDRLKVLSNPSRLSSEYF